MPPFLSQITDSQAVRAFEDLLILLHFEAHLYLRQRSLIGQIPLQFSQLQWPLHFGRSIIHQGLELRILGSFRLDTTL